MDRILITYGTRPFAQRLARLLSMPDRTLYGTCEAIPQLMLDSGKYLEVSHGTSSSYCHEMLTCCLDHEVDTLLPLGKSELRPLAEGKRLFAEYGIQVLVPDPSVLEGLSILENPDSRTPVDIVRDGISLLDGDRAAIPGVSGVLATLQQTLVICCLGD